MRTRTAIKSQIPTLNTLYLNCPLSAYLHFTSQTYTIWDQDTRSGLKKLGFDIPDTTNADPFIYGAYVGTIELIKDLAPFTCFLEHDVPRQRLFQAAIAQYGREA